MTSARATALVVPRQLGGLIELAVNDVGKPTSFRFGPSEDQFTFLPVAIGCLEPFVAAT